ncbi:MAG: hypothetical protein QXG00_05125 [Candidatus Woesearchaeota archaeon]
MNYISIIGFGIASISLILIGILILQKWYKNQKKETLFYWGYGLLLWGISIFLKLLVILSLIRLDNMTIFVIYHIEGFSFCIFLFYGTTSLVLKKRESTVLTLLYYIMIFCVQIYLLLKLRNTTLFYVWNNIIVLTPITLLLTIYFFKYFRKLGNTEIFFVSISWTLLTVINFFYTIIYRISLATHNDSWNLIYSLCIIFICTSYFFLLKIKRESWDVIVSPSHYIINDKLFAAINLYYDKQKTTQIIEELMAAFEIKDLQTASPQKKIDFVDELVKKYFAQLFSLQKLEIFRSELLSILNVDIRRFSSDEASFELGRI